MDIQKEREAFEAWFESNFESTKLHKFDDGVYWHERAQMSWEAWQAAKANAVPDGYVVVPKEPTEKMIDAGHDFCKNNIVTPSGFYKAMIEAAQEQGQ